MISSKHFDNEISALLEARKLTSDLARLLVGRLENFTSSFQPAHKWVLTPVNTTTCSYVGFSKNVIEAIKPLLGKSDSAAQRNNDKKSNTVESQASEQKNDALKALFDKLNNAPQHEFDPAKIDPEGRFAAILGAFITVYPKYLSSLTPEIIKMLPFSDSWITRFGIQAQYDYLSRCIEKYPRLAIFFFPHMSKVQQTDIVTRCIQKNLLDKENKPGMSLACDVIAGIFPHLDERLAKEVINSLFMCIEFPGTLRAVILALGDVYPHITDKEDKSRVADFIICANRYPDSSAMEARSYALANIFNALEEKEQSAVFESINKSLHHEENAERMHGIQVIEDMSYRVNLAYDNFHLLFDRLADIVESKSDHSVRIAAIEVLAKLFKHLDDERQSKRVIKPLTKILSGSLRDNKAIIESACKAVLTVYPHVKGTRDESASMLKRSLFNATCNLCVDNFSISENIKLEWLGVMCQELLDKQSPPDLSIYGINSKTYMPYEQIIKVLGLKLGYKGGFKLAPMGACNGLEKIFPHIMINDEYRAMVFHELLEEIKEKDSKDVAVSKERSNPCEDENVQAKAYEILASLLPHFSDEQLSMLAPMLTGKLGLIESGFVPPASYYDLLIALIPLLKDTKIKLECIDILLRYQVYLADCNEEYAGLKCFPQLFNELPDEQQIAVIDLLINWIQRLGNYLKTVPVSAEVSEDINKTNQVITPRFETQHHLMGMLMSLLYQLERYERLQRAEIQEHLNFSPPVTRIVFDYLR